MKINGISSKPFLKYGLLLITGIFLGWLFFHPEKKSEELHNHSSEATSASVWTCSMHPQIRMEKPGKCPICGMDLIPLTMNQGTSSDPDAIRMTEEAARLAEVRTTIVTKTVPVREVRLYGKVQADERLLQSQTAHVSGRIEKLFVNFTGETVEKGQLLAVIYSPELITAQQELLETARTKQSHPELYEAAIEKLSQWKISEKQIGAIEKTGIPVNNIEILSNTSGIVTARKVNTGDYISSGSVLFEVSDLSRVWVVFDAYESDIPFLSKGESVTFTLQAVPGTEYKGKIVFIDPVIDPVIRVAKVRVETANPAGTLKPEMYATGIIESSPEMLRNNITIPRSAVLWTGKRSIVYVRQPGSEPVFRMREIGIGPMAGESYVVTNGLSEGEEIVTNGTFSVDAAAQLEGKPSMMNVIRSDNKNPEHTSFHVSGNCEMCRERIEKTALAIDGVSEAVWKVETGELVLSYDTGKTDLLSIHRSIAAKGHDTSLIRADDEVYKSLPECCHYRK